ncbi:laminin subunit beta-3 [Diretmus argenteus]
MAAVSSAQNDCSRGACYPPGGDLLLGRAHQLHASSTCGLTGSEVFCTPFQQWKMRCCPCDSRDPNSRLAHTVQDVLSTAAPDRWWQSKKDVNPVTLQLNLHDLFQLDNLVLSFKGPQPKALVIEKTLDDGRTWQPALYMAADCQSAFPGVATTTPVALDQTYCYTLPPVGPNPYIDQIVQFSPLRQYSYVPVPEGQKIHEVSGLRGLRVKLTDLGDVPRLPGRALSKFYALREMKVMGRCMCHGHANRCLPDTSGNPLPNTIPMNPQCECQHNTAGVNCEHCADLYNALPWRPAEAGNTHTCKRCECNNHAQRCRFNQAVYEASGRKNGGVCEGCMHHTTGPKCDQCAPGYQPNPHSRMDRPDACIRCLCSAEGAVNGGHCDDSTGSCQCKANVEGPHCDRCKRGYYGLSASNPMGCTKCSCSPDGSRSTVCDPVTGQCPCHPHFHGLTCELCAHGYWKPFWATTCEPCGCDPTKSLSDTCDQGTGQCQCRPGFGGRGCTDCPDNTYGDPLIRCQPCQCDAEGTLPEGCDKKTGVCLCRLGVTGAHCDSCNRGHCDSFPTCDICPSCFFTLDAQRQNLTLGLERLSPSLPTRPGGTGEAGNFGPHIRALEARLNQIRDSISLPPNSAQQINDALFQLSRLRDQMEQVNGDLSPLDRVPGLDSELDNLRAVLEGLRLEYDAKKDAVGKSGTANNTGAFSTIKKAYDEAIDAAKRVEASGKTVDQSAAIRDDALDLQNQVQPANTRDLEKLNQHLASRPDLTPVAKQVCGSVRSAPCTPLQCEGGELCPAEGAPPCVRGEKCIGALPLSNRAVDDAKEVKDRLERFSGKITKAAEQLQKTHDTATQVRMSAEKLSNQMNQAKDDLEADLKETRDIVKQLKDFLSDPSSNLTQIKEVSDWILKAKLPLNLAALKRKLEELKDLAAGLPNSTAVLKEAGPQLATARKLLEEAQDARDAALGVKADVDGLLEGFGTVEKSLGDLENRLQDSMDITDELNINLDRAKTQLRPAEKALKDISALTGGMKPQLATLKDLLLHGGQLAADATEDARKAKEEADAAAEDVLSLAKQLERLQELDARSGRGDGAGGTSERLKKLRDDAGDLAKYTGNAMKSLADKADSLRRLQGEVIQKSQMLEGLDAKLKGILQKLRVKSHNLLTC